MTGLLIITSVAVLIVFIFIVTLVSIAESKFNKAFQELQDVCEQLEIKLELENTIKAMPPGKDK